MSKRAADGVVVDPAAVQLAEVPAAGGATGQLFQMCVQSGSCSSSAQIPRAAGSARIVLPNPRTGGRAAPLLGLGSRSVSSLPLMVALLGANHPGGGGSQASASQTSDGLNPRRPLGSSYGGGYSGINGRASLGVFAPAAVPQPKARVISLHQSQTAPDYLLGDASRCSTI